MSSESIIFPGINLTLENVGRGLDVFGFHIAFYGMVIALGMLLAYVYIGFNAKRYGRNPDDLSDITFAAIVSGVIGARIYYVIFSWDLYKDDLLSIFNLRLGGLGIFGGIIAGGLGVFVMSRIKKLNVFHVGDIVIPGVLIGQILGRWGNFFNREAFGGYSDGILRMGLPIDGVRSSLDITQTMLDNSKIVEGVEFVFVHPTFLYESLWNLCLLVILVILGNKNHKVGLACGIYFLGYGVGRFFIESLRTDQLLIPGTQIPVSMVVAVFSVIFALICIFVPHEKTIDKAES